MLRWHTWDSGSVRSSVNVFSLLDVTTRHPRNYLSLGQIFKKAVRKRMVSVSPCQLEKGELPRLPPAATRFLDSAEVKRLSEAMNPPYDLLVLLLAQTGIRFGEAAALHVGAGATFSISGSSSRNPSKKPTAVSLLARLKRTSSVRSHSPIPYAPGSTSTCPPTLVILLMLWSLWGLKADLFVTPTSETDTAPGSRECGSGATQHPCSSAHLCFPSGK
jgi:hypothetical protein